VNVKTPEQIEFTDLARELKEKFGFNQRRIAEVCRFSESMVSQIIAGTRSPGKSSLELLRRELDELTVPKPRGEVSPQILRDQLEELEENDPDGYRAASVMIKALHDRAANIKITPEEEKAFAAAPGAQKLSQSPARKQKAAAPNADKRGPDGDAGSHRK